MQLQKPTSTKIVHPKLMHSTSAQTWKWSKEHETYLLPVLSESEADTIVPEVQDATVDWWPSTRREIPWDRKTNSCAWDSAIHMANCLGIAVCRQDIIPPDIYSTRIVSPAHHELRTILWDSKPLWGHKTPAQLAQCRKRIHEASSLPTNDCGYKSVAITVEELLTGSNMASWTYRKYVFCGPCNTGEFHGNAKKRVLDLTKEMEKQVKLMAARSFDQKLPLSDALQYWSGTFFHPKTACPNVSCRRRLSVCWLALDRLPRYLPIDGVWCAKLGNVIQWEKTITFGMLHENKSYISHNYRLRGIHIYRKSQHHFEFYGKLGITSAQWYRWGKLPSHSNAGGIGVRLAEPARIEDLDTSDVSYVYVIYEKISDPLSVVYESKQ